ncbi:MAG: hypothetical protein FJ388_13965 [Verrucomicrobia bacterium]|nr:hypothetical protein [Verrucomicrobiota bacterium]
MSKRDSTKYQNPDPLPLRLRGLNRVAVVVSCLCGVGLAALLLFSISARRDDNYLDYKPPAGLSFAYERPSKESSADEVTEQDEANLIRDTDRQSRTNHWWSFRSSPPRQPKPRMLFEDPLEQTVTPADRSPVGKGPGAPPSQ